MLFFFPSSTHVYPPQDYNLVCTKPKWIGTFSQNMVLKCFSHTPGGATFSTHSVHIQYRWRIVGAGGCLVVVTQWWNTSHTSQVSWVWFTVTVISLFHLITSLVPRPPLFLPSVCVHNSTWEWKTGEFLFIFRFRILWAQTGDQNGGGLAPRLPHNI